MLYFIGFIFVFFNLEFCHSCEDICGIYEVENIKDKCIKGCRFFKLIDAIHSTQLFEFKISQCNLACEEAYYGRQSSCHIGCSSTDSFQIVGMREKGLDDYEKREWGTENAIIFGLYSLSLNNPEPVSNSKAIEEKRIFMDLRLVIISVCLVGVVLAIFRIFSPKRTTNHKLSIYGDGNALQILPEKINLAAVTSSRNITEPLKLKETQPQILGKELIPYIPINEQIPKL